MDKFNRRTLWIASSAFLTINHIGIVILYWLQNKYEIPGFYLILCVMLIWFSFVCAGLIFPLMGLLRGELFPQSAKMIGNGLSQCLISLICFITARVFLPVSEMCGIEINFLIYACFASLIVLYTFFDLPETRGKTLVEIQNELKGIKSSKIESGC